MQASFVYFDSALIEYVFQPLADFITNRIGLERPRVVGFCLDAASIAWILSQAQALTRAVTEWDASAAFLRVLLLLLGLMALTGLRAVFRRVGAGSGKNPLRVTMLPHRCVVLALLVAHLPMLTGFADIADLLMLSFAACALYIGACATRPPARRCSRWVTASGLS